jgi:hypothetical protein
VDDLIAFLKARLDEDVKVARDATFWTGGVPEWTARAEPDWVHIARHDPARVLAEVEAKRRIIDRAEFVANHGPARDHVRALDMTTGASAALRDVLRLLALPYADHPAYREEWRP